MSGSFLYRVRRTFKESSAYGVLRHLATLRWRLAGKPVPPPHAVKESVLRKYASRFRLSVLIETGTFLGDMAHRTRNVFEQIHTIELHDELWKKAIVRFQRFPQIRLYHGDSGQVLPEVLRDLERPALFWLDGHHSGGFTAKGSLSTPILQEIRAIVDHSVQGHVILIDDARCFNGTDDYPTLAELHLFFQTNAANYQMHVENDIIRILPKTTNVTL